MKYKKTLKSPSDLDNCEIKATLAYNENIKEAKKNKH